MAELDKQFAQVADLSHAYQQQEEALLLVREAIESLRHVGDPAAAGADATGT